MTTRIDIGDMTVDVTHKDIKNIHLSVYPPHGRVKISAPLHMDIENIKVFAISKLPWIRQQQRKLREQERETPREYIDLESHHLWGKRYLLKVIENNAAPYIELQHSHLVLHVRPGTGEEKKESLLADYYRAQVRKAARPLIEKWEKQIGVTVNRLFVQPMKTRWGSCNHAMQNIRLNTELAKKPPQCFEYILVHEMIHLLEPTHNARFLKLMDHHMPNWRHHRDLLNELPVRHENWEY